MESAFTVPDRRRSNADFNPINGNNNFSGRSSLIEQSAIALKLSKTSGLILHPITEKLQIKDAKYRIELTRRCLRDLGVL
ncbi:hypothetical protein QUB60_00875 [Microcoleus sp. A2-C5]|uniref:hypothetical protein n=1 Tax=unclassified Microcoleus TaxID=2642155 RepID=UPI002FD0AA27